MITIFLRSSRILISLFYRFYLSNKTTSNFLIALPLKQQQLIVLLQECKKTDPIRRKQV